MLMDIKDYVSRIQSETILPSLKTNYPGVDLEKLGFLVRNLDDHGVMVDAAVRSNVKTQLMNQMQWSGAVHSTFFSGSTRPVISPKDQGFVDQTITALVCSSISASSLYGFSGMINKAAADNLWQTNVKSSKMTDENKALYDCLFSTYCSAGTDTFNFYLSNNAVAYAEALAECVMTDEYVTMVLPTIFSDSNWLKQLSLTLYKLSRLNNSLVAGVLQKWTSTYPDKGIAADLANLGYTDATAFTEDEFLSQVNSVISQSTVTTSTSPETGHGMGGTTFTFTTYGQDVVTFVTHQANEYGLYTGQQPDNMVETNNHSFGCFIGKAPLMLADGRQIAIDSIKPGDLILSYAHGKHATSTHSEELVSHKLTSPETIYGFNEFSPFFTAGHPFMTPDGWKAINPDIANEENPSFGAKKLEVGDEVYRLAGLEVGVPYELVRIESFSQSILPAGEKIYGLHLFDGPHSYHVNRFVVRMNYPMLTEDRLMKGFSVLSPQERKLILKAFTPVMPLLKKAVGGFIEKPLLRALNPASSTVHAAVSEGGSFTHAGAGAGSSGDSVNLQLLTSSGSIPVSKKKHVIPAAFDLSTINEQKNYAIKCFNMDTFHYENSHLFDQLHFDGRDLYLTGNGFAEKIDNHSIRGNKMKWLHAKDGVFSSGFTSGELHFSPDGRTFTGTMFIGKDAASATSHSVSGTLPPQVYHTQVSTLGSPTQSNIPSPADPKEWKDGIQLQLSLIMLPGATPTPQLVICVFSDSNKDSDAGYGKGWVPLSGDPDSTNNFDPQVQESISSTGTYIITFPSGGDNIDAVQAFGDLWPANGQLTFSFDANGFTGYLQTYNATTGKISTNYYAWKGTLVTPKPALSPMLETKFAAVRATSMLSASRTLTADPSAPLSLPDLIVTAPADADVRSLANQMLIENMKWAIGGMSNSWLSDFFGQNRPVLSQDRIDDINKNLDFYTNEFAMGYLGYALNQIRPDHGGPTTPLTAEQSAKLDTFMKTGLAKQQGFATQTTLIHRRAYVESSARLQQYLADTTVSWAQLLCNFSSSNQQIMLMAGAITGNSVTALGVINERATLLAVLDPESTGEYVTTFYTKLNSSGAFGQWTQAFSADKNAISAWITHFLEAFTNGGPDAGEYTLALSPSSAFTPTYGIFYVSISGTNLLYTVINPAGITVNGQITQAELGQDISTFLDGSGALDLAKLQLSLAAILKITAQKGDTYDPSKNVPGTVTQEYIKEIKDIQLEAIKNGVDLADALGAFIVATFSPSNPMSVFDRLFGTDIQSNIDSFMEKYPKLTFCAGKFASMVRVCAISFGIFEVVSGFKNWATLNDAERAGVVISTIGLIGPMIEAVPSLVNGAKSVLSFMDKVKIRAFASANPDAFEEIEMTLIDKDGNAAENIAGAVSESGELEASWASRFAEAIELPLKGLGFLVSAAFAGLAIYNFVEDFTGNKSVEQKAFDGIIASSAVIQTVFVGLDIFASDCACAAAFGPAGIVFAVIGLIFTLVEMFEPQPKPESPIDKFFDTLRPFVDALPAPDKAKIKRALSAMPDKKRNYVSTSLFRHEVGAGAGAGAGSGSGMSIVPRSAFFPDRPTVASVAGTTTVVNSTSVAGTQLVHRK